MALPTSVIATFIIMYVLGFSLNMMTLLGLSLAIGLLIDDAVVVRENISKHLERGVPPMQAALDGTSEIALSVFATTMTVVAVFVPVAFMSGVVGQFFRQFGHHDRGGDADVGVSSPSRSTRCSRAASRRRASRGSAIRSRRSSACSSRVRRGR